MLYLACIAVAALLLADADIPRGLRWRPEPASRVEFPPGQSLPLLPDITPAAEQQTPAPKATQLQPQSRLELVRYVSGEFARALKPLPTGKKGVRIKVGQPLDEKVLQQLVASNGPAVSTGETVQVTKLEFRDHEIVLDLNGGGRGKTRWRQNPGPGGRYAHADGNHLQPQLRTRLSRGRRNPLPRLRTPAPGHDSRRTQAPF